MSFISFDNLQKVLGEYAEYVSNTAKSNMPSYYELRNKMDFYVQIDDKFYSVEFKAPEYWKWANYGRKPGKMPPINAIEQWINVRGITPKSKNGLPVSEKSLAFLIARKIGRDGTEGSHFLEPAVENAYNTFENQISIAVTKDLVNALKNMKF